MKNIFGPSCPYKQRACIMVKDAHNLLGENSGEWQAFFVTEIRKIEGYDYIYGYFIKDIVKTLSKQQTLEPINASGSLGKVYKYFEPYCKSYRKMTSKEKQTAREQILPLLLLWEGEKKIKGMKDALFMWIISLIEERFHPNMRIFVLEVEESLR